MKLCGVYGSGGFGRQVMPLMRQQTWGQEDVECVFIDDVAKTGEINGHECLTFEAFLARPASERSVAIAIGDGNIRAALAKKCTASGVQFMSVRAPNSVIMDEVFIGDGVVLCSFSMITSNVKIGRQFHANHYSYVAHDCVIGDFVTFAAGVMCSGNVHIDNHAYIGSGAMIRQGLTIGAGAVVGMGAVVTRDVAPGVTVIGNPAKPLIKG